MKRSPAKIIPSILITEEHGRAAWRLEAVGQWKEVVVFKTEILAIE